MKNLVRLTIRACGGAQKKVKNLMLKNTVLVILGLFLASCSGIKVVNPERTKDAGTMMVDWSGGVPKVVSTHTCSIVASNGQRVSALGKSEAEARQEALAKCRSQTIVSFCLEKNLSCVEN